ncbi:MAG: alanine--glyoxylate aminotransferase family protein [Desulfohalobiaceae bacterium]|nr:alanine--glyoxylate aminotransferase family protein [Desulfohalobiaceae bacterium]
MSIDPHSFKEIDPGKRILMGPGPSNVPPRVLQAMAAPCIGHLDPEFLTYMNEAQQLLRYCFQTRNPFTLPVSGTGSAGMETSLVNFVEPGDNVLVCVNGVFGLRMCDLTLRLGGNLIQVKAEWGRAIDPEAVRRAVKGRDLKLLAVVHAETSTGACTTLEDLADIAHEAGALFLVDMVTSFAGMDVAVDRTGIDIAFSGTQKCLSCPPGLSPVTFGSRAMEVLQNRKTKVPSWYLDMNMVGKYWGAHRKYHHTAAVNMIYALRESLRIVAEEGLEKRWERHFLNHRALVAGLEAMGLSMVVPERERLPMLNTVWIPEGADDAFTRRHLLQAYAIEIGAGLGDLAGRVWRVGLMGHTAQPRNVLLFLSALEATLRKQNIELRSGGMEAAAAVYEDAW